MEGKKRIVFVAVPEKGKEDDEISRTRQLTANAYLRMSGLTIQDVAFVPAFNNKLNKTQVPKGANAEIVELAEAVRRLGLADEAIFEEHWHKDDRCKFLKDICKLYNVKTNEY